MAEGARRLLGLDALRGIAVLLMIEQHLGVWLWSGPAPGRTMADYTGLFVFNALGGGAAPAFVTLAGMGASLLISKRPAPDRALLLRGLVVMSFGYGLSWITPSWFEPRNSWFVLHLMGFGMFTTPVWRRIPSSGLIALAVAILLGTGFVQAALSVPLSLDNEYMAGRSPRDVTQWVALRRALADGQFPIFPWFSFYLAGLVSGRWLGRAREGERSSRIALLGGGALALGLVGVALRPLALGSPTSVLARASSLRVPFFPASPTLVVLLLAVVLLGIWLVVEIDRRHPLAPTNPLVTLGRASLSLLLVHVWLFRELSRPLGMWQQLSLGAATATMLGFILVAVLLTRLWHQIDYRFGAEWLLRKLAP